MAREGTDRRPDGSEPDTILFPHPATLLEAGGGSGAAARALPGIGAALCVLYPDTSHATRRETDGGDVAFLQGVH